MVVSKNKEFLFTNSLRIILGFYYNSLVVSSHRVLRNISPTSVYCEQAFSIATSFITKLRSRLCDQSIDDLQFEKGYFAKESYYK